MLSGIYLVGQLNWGFWQTSGLMSASLAVSGYFYDMLWIAHWRAEIANFIQQHAADIQTAA
jgi:hypothetical protein